MAAAHTLTLLADSPLPGGYRQLTFQSESALMPAPGHLLRAAPATGVAALHAPVMLMPASDRFQVLARTQIQLAPGTRIENVKIEGDAPAPDPARPRIVLVSSDGALACSIFAASRLRKQYGLIAFAHFDMTPPFHPAPSQILLPACPPESIAAVPLLDAWNIPSRVASAQERSGFYHGDIRGLLDYWWSNLNVKEGTELQVLAFGDDRFLGGLKQWCHAHAIPLRTSEIPSWNL